METMERLPENNIINAESESDHDGNMSENDVLIQDKRPLDSPTLYIYLLTIFAALGGFLFGYDTGVISGAMLLGSTRRGYKLQR